MTRNVVENRQHNGRWIVIGVVLALIGLAAVITSFILGNTWNEEGGTSHGVTQGALLIPGAIVCGVGIVLLVIGLVKRGPKAGEQAGVTRR
ncbi:hypothetical protein OH146_00370 [Salinibacterium sp. SYSU T00001]|uniref:hypothetical protein n=1 Tax=Homoserinimonas sedimenticola TaxID=2986805 RepID=UPI002235D69F|nr:hypothetical protein [Salinibacterium sedimenticola]MCW4384224.1 hypothetical protein [Salinibacterium sedimenticola]